MKKVIKIGLLCLLIIPGCDNPISIDNPSNQTDLNEQLKKVNIVQTGYKVISFKNSDSLFMNSKYVQKIIVGYFQNQNFIPTDSVIPTYQLQNNSKYLLSFSDSLTVTDTTLYLRAGIKYLLSDDTYVTVNKDLFLLSYPYETTRYIDRYPNFTPPNIIWVQDFVYQNYIMYYHPTGPWGLYMYDFRTYETILIYDYPGGDFFDINSTDAFIDYGHRFVWKYSLLRDTIVAELDLQTALSSDNNFGIHGIAANDSSVFVKTSNPNKLVTLNNDLEILNVKDFNAGSYGSMTFSNGYLYTLIYNAGIILKIDPASNQIIDQKMTPSKFTSVIKINNGLLYFIDDEWKLFACTPLNDIFK